MSPPTTTSELLKWLDGNDEPMTLSSLDSYYEGAKWKESFEYSDTLLRGFLSSVYVKGEPTPVRNTSSITIKKGTREDLDRPKVDLIGRHPQRIDLIPRIAQEIHDALRSQNLKVKNFDQATFVVFKPGELQNGRCQAKTVDCSFFGWRSDVPELYSGEVEKWTSADDKPLSLRHFEQFLVNEDAWFADIVKHTYSLSLEEAVMAYIGRVAGNEVGSGVEAYLKAYQTIRSTIDSTFAYVWISTRPKSFDDNIEAQEKILATFWSAELTTNPEKEDLGKAKAALQAKIGSIRHRMLQAFSQELIDQREDLVRQNRELAEIHQEIRRPLNYVLRALKGLDSKARYISHVVDPVGAIFLRQRDIKDLFEDNKKTIPDLPNVNRQHDVDGWVVREQKWVIAKTVSLLAGVDRAWQTNDDQSAALDESFNALKSVVKTLPDFLEHRYPFILSGESLDKIATDIKSYEDTDDRCSGPPFETLRKLKKIFHSHYKFNPLTTDLPTLKELKPFLPISTRFENDYDSPLTVLTPNPLKSAGHALEAFSNLICQRWQELHKLGKPEPIKVAFSDDKLDAKLSFLNADTIDKLVESLTKPFDFNREEEASFEVECGNTVRSLLRFREITQMDFKTSGGKIEIKTTEQEAKITFDWIAHDGTSTLQLIVSDKEVCMKRQ